LTCRTTRFPAKNRKMKKHAMQKWVHNDYRAVSCRDPDPCLEASGFSFPCQAFEMQSDLGAVSLPWRRALEHGFQLTFLQQTGRQCLSWRPWLVEAAHQGQLKTSYQGFGLEKL
jgi:hypothetical protein